jgi:hypothetical protein
MSYNGYKNWETWNVALWFANDEGLYRAAMEQVIEAGPFSALNVDNFVSELLPDGTPDFQDMGRARCYAKVQWGQVARCLNEFAE